MKKITKANAKKFTNTICEKLKELGAVSLGKVFDSNEFSLDTIAGKMSITVREEHSYTYSVFCKFEEPQRAKEKFNCNPHSGKYNFHVGGDLNVDKAIELALMHVECTLPSDC